jgi:hypothetical protein
MIATKRYELAYTALRSVITIPTVKPKRKGVFHKTIPSPVKEPSKVKGRVKINAGCLLEKFLHPLRNILKGRKREYTLDEIASVQPEPELQYLGCTFS